MNASSPKLHVFLAACAGLGGVLLFLWPICNLWLGNPLGLRSNALMALGGILPVSDARDFFRGACLVADGIPLDLWNTRRPLNAVLFAARLWAAGFDYQAALLLAALACGLACVLAAWCVYKASGLLAAAITYCVLLDFAQPFLTTGLSETLGLFLGSLAFVLLWEGTEAKKPGYFEAGVFLLTVALGARSGANLVLPLLVLAAGKIFAPKGRFGWKAAGLAACAMLCAMAFDRAVQVLFCARTAFGVMHYVFALTVFGLVSGGKTWTWATQCYPHFQGDGFAFALFLYERSWETFLSHPRLLALGLWENTWGVIRYVLDGYTHVLTSFTAVPLFCENPFPRLLLRASGLITAMLFAIMAKKRLAASWDRMLLVLAGLAGMFFSAAIVWLDGYSRVFAPAMPFMAAALGLAFGKSPRPAQNNVPAAPTAARLALVLSVLVLAGGLTAALVLKSQTPGWIKASAAPAQPGPGKKTLIVTKPFLLPHLIVYKGNALKKTRVPNVSEDDFKQMVAESRFEDTQVFLDLVDHFAGPRVGLGLLYDHVTQDVYYVAGPASLFDPKHGAVRIQAALQPDGLIWRALETQDISAHPRLGLGLVIQELP